MKPLFECSKVEVCIAIFKNMLDRFVVLIGFHPFSDFPRASASSQRVRAVEQFRERVHLVNLGEIIDKDDCRDAAPQMVFAYANKSSEEICPPSILALPVHKRTFEMGKFSHMEVGNVVVS